MKIARYFCLAAIVFTLAGCYKDKGNYEYEDLIEPLVSVPWSNEVVQGETLRIEPEFEPQAPRTIDDYLLEWYIESEKVGEGLVLEIPDYQGVMGTRTNNTLLVTDRITDAKYTYSFSIETIAPMQSGWAILTDDGGQTKLHFLRENRASTQVDDVTYTPYLDCVEDLPASPKKLIEHWNARATSVLGEVAVICDQNQVWELSGDNLAKVVDLKMEFMDETFPADLNVSDIMYLYHGSYVYTKDGNMYGRKNNDMEGYHTGRYLSLPVQPTGGGMKVGFTTNVMSTGRSNQGLVYDSEHKRYIVITDYYYSDSDAGLVIPVTRYSSSVSSDVIQTIDLSNMGDVKIYGCVSHMSGYYDNPYYAIVEKEGKFYVQDFTIQSSWGSVSCTKYTLTEIQWGNLLSDDSQFIENASGTYVFFTSGDKIYYNRRNTDQPKLFESYNGVKVNTIAVDLYEYDRGVESYQLSVGLEDGRFIMYDVSLVGMNEVEEGREPIVIYEQADMGNIKSIIYKIGALPFSRM